MDAIDLKKKRDFKLNKVMLWTCVASAFPEMQFLIILWQIKNDTLAGQFDFAGAGHCFIGMLNVSIKVVSDGLLSQKQCIIIPSGMRQ